MRAGPIHWKFYMQNKEKLHFKKQMHVLHDSKSGCFSAPVPWVRSNGSEQETGVR